MSYDVSIHRDDPFRPITLEEWTSLIEHDDEMRAEERAEYVFPDGAKLVAKPQGLAFWEGHPESDNPDRRCWFSYSKGQIIVSSPDELTMEKMRSIALALDAVVVGEDGEPF
jgi:hypothetical protein